MISIKIYFTKVYYGVGWSKYKMVFKFNTCSLGDGWLNVVLITRKYLLIKTLIETTTEWSTLYYLLADTQISFNKDGCKVT